jgi:hypothetical protein
LACFLAEDQFFFLIVLFEEIRFFEERQEQRQASDARQRGKPRGGECSRENFLCAS